MRVFSTVFIATVLALSSVNAAAVEKRAFSTAGALCISDINSITEQLYLIETEAKAFTPAAGYAGVTAIHDKESELESRIVKATTDCNAIGTYVNPEESNVILHKVELLSAGFDLAIDSIARNILNFAAIYNATTIIKNDIKSLETKTIAFETVLISKFPKSPYSYANIIIRYYSRINDSFVWLKKFYDISD